jgi:hypothetical protein
LLLGVAIPISRDGEHLAWLSLRLNSSRDNLQAGGIRGTATFNEGSINANHHLLRGLVRYSILCDCPLNLFVDAFAHGQDAASRGSVIGSARGW